MRYIRDRAPLLLLLLGISLLITATAFGADFQQNDVALAKKTAKGLALTQKGLPAIATVMIVFYIFQSFLFRLISDMAFHKWAASVVLNIMLFSAFFGGSLGNAVGQFRPHKNASQISKVVTDTYPGDGAQESATPSGMNTHFEVLASMFDNSDETLGSEVGGNLAMIQTVTGTDHTKWALNIAAPTTLAASGSNGVFGWISDLFAAAPGDLGIGTTPAATAATTDAPQQELFDSIAEINSGEANTNLLAGSLLYLNNAVASVAGDIQASYDSRQMIDAAQGDEANPAGSSASASLTEDVFAASSISAASAANRPVTVVTMATYPGGVNEYGRHALTAISTPDKHYHAGTVSANQITLALSSSNQKAGKLNASLITTFPSPTATGPGTVFEYAKQGGFDGDTHGVHPQYYLRAHNDLQASECGSNSGSSRIRPGGSGGSGGIGIFNPEANIPSLPILVNTAAITTAASVFGSLSNFATNGNGGDLLTAINGTIQMYSQLNSYAAVKSIAAIPTNTAAGIIARYDQLITDSTTNGMGHATVCLQNGKAMLTVATAISKKSGENDIAYHAYLNPTFGTPGAIAEATSTLAWSVGKDDASADVLASKHENLASVSEIVHHIVGYVSAIGTGGGSASMQTKLPVGQESSWMRPDQKLETLIKGGQEKANGAALNESGKPKGTMEKIGSAIAGTLQEMIATYYQFVLRLLVVLLAGMPFIVLLTQVCIATTVAHFSYSIGMAILPIWAVMNTGKLFSNASAGDESYNGVAFFPIITIIATTACLGAEVAAAKVCQGEVQFYLTHIVDIFFAQLEAIGYALGTIFTQGSHGNSFSFKQVLTPMMEAVKPFGVCAAATIAPMLIGRILMPGVIAPHGSASMVAGMASSAHEGGAAAVGGKVKAAAGAAIGGAVGGPAGAKAGADAASK